MSVEFGEGGSITGQLVRLVLLITVLGLAPSILVMVTSFTRIVVVLSFLRTTIGLQQTPPNAVLVSLALFLTAFIIAPTLERVWQEGVAPLIEEEIDEAEAFERVTAPLRAPCSTTSAARTSSCSSISPPSARPGRRFSSSSPRTRRSGC